MNKVVKKLGEGLALTGVMMGAAAAGTTMLFVQAQILDAVEYERTFDSFQKSFEKDPDRMGGCQKGVELKIPKKSFWQALTSWDRRKSPEFKCDDGRIISYSPSPGGYKYTTYLALDSSLPKTAQPLQAQRTIAQSMDEVARGVVKIDPVRLFK